MTFKNIYGRRGAGPIGGYQSLNAYRKAQKEKRLKDVAERIAALESVEARKSEHYEAWLRDRCITGELRGGITIESSTASLRASYLDFYGRNSKSAQAWGRWMGERFLKVVRNTAGVGRVYLGIALKPAAAPQDLSPTGGNEI